MSMKNNRQVVLEKYSRVFILLLILIGLSIISPHSFLSVSNMSTVLFQEAPITILMSFGMTLSIITLGIDVSMGSVLVLSSVVSAGLIKNGQIVAGILVALLIGALIGLLNGVLITKVGLEPFIATYGMNAVALGLAYVYTGGVYIYDFPQGFRQISNKTVLGVPSMAIIVLIVFLVLYFVTQKTSFGFAMYSSGTNFKATVLCGINAAAVVTLVYVINGLLASVSGILYMARLNAADPGISGDFTMDSIAATLIGGTPFTGGEGSVQRTVIGGLIIVFIRNGMNILNISTNWQQTVIGFIIIFSIIFEGIVRQNMMKRASKPLKMQSKS